MFDQYTLGIEEEFQIVDPRTRELRSHVTEFLEEGKMLLGEQIKPEMIQSMVEVGTGVCKNIQEARVDISRLRSIISALAAKNGLVISHDAQQRGVRLYILTSHSRHSPSLRT